MNDSAILEDALSKAEELLRRKARDNFSTFVRLTKAEYQIQWFHKVICDKLQLFVDGKIKKMMILLPPQHGKTELATRRLPPFLLGKNPNLKIAVASYSDAIVQGFNRDIQRIIDSDTYHGLFPETLLAGSQFADPESTHYARNYHEFEVVNARGSVKTVGRGGSLTGSAVDVGIIDDLYKDRSEAKSMAVSTAAWEWYTDVFLTRLHNDSQQLIMNTRWDQQDLAGRLIEREGQDWEIIKFAALRTTDQVPYDPRPEGEALWESRHSRERILKIKEVSQVTFNSLYQQDPKPNTDILVHPNWIEIPFWPELLIEKNGKTEWVSMEIKSWGLDFGKTTGINALVKHAINGENAYFEENLYEPGVATKGIAELLLANGYVTGTPVYCDHIPTKIAELRRLGIAAFPAIKGAGSIQAGIDKLKEYKCHYTKRSANLKHELNVYQFVTYGDMITNMPVDEDNHLMDACRYANYSTSFRQTG